MPLPPSLTFASLCEKSSSAIVENALADEVHPELTAGTEVPRTCCCTAILAIERRITRLLASLLRGMAFAPVLQHVLADARPHGTAHDDGRSAKWEDDIEEQEQQVAPHFDWYAVQHTSTLAVGRGG